MPARPGDPAPQPTALTRPGVVFLAGRAILRPLLKLRYRARVSGLEHVPEAGAVLLVSNHLSMLDTILIPSLTSRQVRFLAKSSLFESRVGGWFMREIGSVPVVRGAGSEAQGALLAGQAVLSAGEVFAIFPEGSRARDGRLYRGRSGAAFMALATGAQVVPVGLIGTNRRLKDPHSGRAPRVQVKFGPVVPLDDLAGLPAGQARREATARIMAAIQSLTDQELAGEYSPLSSR